jgi:hypothetical protein
LTDSADRKEFCDIRDRGNSFVVSFSHEFPLHEAEGQAPACRGVHKDQDEDDSWEHFMMDKRKKA